MNPWRLDCKRRQRPAGCRAVEALTEAEQAELQGLQEAADRRLEERDWELLAGLERFKQAVTQLPSDTETP
jgi:hypothetical protein